MGVFISDKFGLGSTFAFESYSRPIFVCGETAFRRLRIRIGGSLQDQVKYDVGNPDSTCHPFAKADSLFGFSDGCLNMSRWDDLNNFFIKTGAIMTFGLNALYGRHKISDREWGGDWNSSNAYAFMNFTISKGYQIDSWEFGVDPNIVDKILNPLHLSGVSKTFSSLKQTIQTYGPWASAWVGESGGAYNSGGRHVSDTFVNSFWYLDQLGIAAEYNTKVYCRQTLIGGNYGLLDTTTFIPNPDYYSALLWNQLMGKGVLSVDSNASPHLRSYAHCSKGRAGVTLLLINLSNQTYYKTSVQSTASGMLITTKETDKRKKTLVHHLKKAVSWIGGKASDEEIYREVYHLTPKDGDIKSKIMLLNGTPLVLAANGDIPSLAGVHVNSSSPLSVDPLSIKFIVLPNFIAPGCK